MTSLVVLLVAAVALVRGSPLKGTPGLQPYHEAVGIPMLARTKQYEMGRDFDGSRIVGGSAVPPGTHPFLGGIFINLADRRTSMCGATLLTNTRALTAAHCWFDGQLQAVQFTMVYGSAFLLSGGVRIPTAQVTMHENWNPLQAVQHDIAIVTHVWVTFNNNMNRILLPAGSQLNQNWVGLNAVAAGYGRTTDDDFSAPARPEKNQVTLQVITNDVCMQYYGPANIDPSILCTSGAGGRNICSGDSGGPLSLGTGTSRVLIGVSSFGYQYCTAGIPAAFSRVTYYADWIRARI